MIHIEVANRQTRLAIDTSRLAHACERILSAAGYDEAELSVAVVDDHEMRRLNRDYLDHDYTTDVLSFPLDAGPGRLAGEIVVSTGVAARHAERLGVEPLDELLLYVVHGTLHLVGHGDKAPDEAAAMRAAEQYWLAELGIPADCLRRLDVAADEIVPSGDSLR